MKQISDTYAKQYGMIVEEIIQVRSQFGLGIRPYAKILGIGSASVTRHESGELPSEKHMEIYRELQSHPQLIQEYYNRNKRKLTPREQKQAEAVLARWQPKSSQDDEEIIEAIHKRYDETEMTGFTPFNLDKFMHMIFFYAANGMAITKLMKLLWYADFLHYKRQTVSISGASYARFPFGPVPMDHDITLAHLQHMNAIEIQESINDEGWTLKTITALQNFDSTLFDSQELAVLEEVRQYFSDFGARRISDYSHEEVAWRETPEKHPISYKFAAALRDFNQ